MKEIYANITWNKKTKKKEVNFGKVWGRLPKEEANATALLTGNGLIVIDIDTKKLKNIDKKLIGFLGKPTIETKRGYHYYFNVKDSSLFTTRSKLFENVDIRSEGGLVFNSYWGGDKNISYDLKTKDVPVIDKKLHKYILKQTNPKSSKKNKTTFNYNNTDKKKVKELLKHIDCYDEYDGWYQVGMALRSWDEVEGLKLWDKWSKQSESYDGGTIYKWKSFSGNGDLGLGSLYHMAEKGGYVIPHKPDFSKKEGVSVASKDYVAPEMIVKRDVFFYEPWMGEAPVDKKAVIAYLKNTGWDAKATKFRWVSSSGKIRDFTRKHMNGFFKYIRAEETEETLKVIDKWLSEYGTLTIPNPKEYWKYVYNNMEAWIMFHHQYKTMRLTVDPFGTNGVAFDEETMLVISDNILPKSPNKVYDDKVVADYKEHFPQLDEVLDVMLSARFGADRKKAYTWMKAESDWGKSFFFVGVLGSLGITTILKEKELKLAMSGSPSGLMGEDFYRSWVTVFEEFKGAISELKDITHNLILAPKGQARVEVDLYSKIFLSAENVNSLIGDGGAETQFANRFMMIELNGIMTNREVYNNNQHYYLDVIKRYVFDYFMKGIKMYIALGKNDASIHANKVLNSFRKDHQLKAENLMDNVSDILKVYYAQIKKDLRTFGVDNNEIKSLYEMKAKVLYIKKLGLCRDHFLKTMFAHNDVMKLNHKSSLELLGLDKVNRVNILLSDIKQNAYKVD